MGNALKLSFAAERKRPLCTATLLSLFSIFSVHVCMESHTSAQAIIYILTLCIQILLSAFKSFSVGIVSLSGFRKIKGLIVFFLFYNQMDTLSFLKIPFSFKASSFLKGCEDSISAVGFHTCFIKWQKMVAFPINTPLLVPKIPVPPVCVRLLPGYTCPPIFHSSLPLNLFLSFPF